jgi:hypothetical protein
MAITRGKTTQFIVHVPTTSAAYVRRVAKKWGVSESVFCAMALMDGTASLERKRSPEAFFPPELVDAIAKAGLELAREQAAGAAEPNEKV